VAIALGDEPRIDAAVLNAPMFGIALGWLPIWLATAIARIACLLGLGDRYVSAKSTDPQQIAFEDNIITHDRGRWDSHRAQLRACPDLAVGGVTWGWLDNALEAMAEANRPQTAAALTKPLLILAAGDERVVDNRRTRIFAARAPKARYVEIPAARHEIMMETDQVRAAFWAEVDRFVAGL
jgi:lysophospholipase